MSDDNIVEFKKKVKENTENNKDTIEERVIKCATTPNCTCMYCTYKKGAAEMVMEFLAMDVMNFEKKTGANFCTYDLKEVLFESIMHVKELEKDIVNGEEAEEPKKD